MKRGLLAIAAGAIATALAWVAACVPVGAVAPAASVSVPRFAWPDRLPVATSGQRGVIYEDARVITDWRSGRVPNALELSPEEADIDHARLLAEAAGSDWPEGYDLSFESGGSFVIRPVEGEHAGAPGELRQHLTFVSAERDDASKEIRLQRTWFTFAEPESGEPRGLAILMPGMFATPREVADRAERGLLLRGWAVLRMLSPPSRMSGHITFTVPLDSDRSEVIEAIALEMDTRVAECAYAVKAAADHVVRGSAALQHSPRVIIGMSGSGIALPTIVAFEPEKYAAAVIVAGGANAFSIARRSSYRDWIDAIGFGFTPREPMASELARLDAEYLQHSTLDAYHTAPAMRRVRTLMIHGSADTAVPADAGELLWERLGRGERWVMPVGHELVFAALPVRMVALLDWLESAAAEPSP